MHKERGAQGDRWGDRGDSSIGAPARVISRDVIRWSNVRGHILNPQPTRLPIYIINAVPNPIYPAVKRPMCCSMTGQPHPNIVLREAGQSTLHLSNFNFKMSDATAARTEGDSVKPTSEIDSEASETPGDKISKMLQMLQDVAQCCKAL